MGDPALPPRIFSERHGGSGFALVTNCLRRRGGAYASWIWVSAVVGCDEILRDVVPVFVYSVVWTNHL